MRTLKSEIDMSENYVFDKGDLGFFESRFVKRPNTNYFNVYLSSHTGCDRACRFCHLTSTGQTGKYAARIEDFREQALPALLHTRDLDLHDRIMHYNFMARGEPLDNPILVHNWEDLVEDLRFRAQFATLGALDHIRFNISTIMPTGAEGLNLYKHFGDTVNFYYSLYSFNPDFRKRWLPKAMDPKAALKKLHKWQLITGKQITIHFALIQGENDSLVEHQEIIDYIKSIGLDVKFNLVRYNPPNTKSKESKDAELIFNLYKHAFPDSKIIPRVGFDVKASCGMFVERNTNA